MKPIITLLIVCKLQCLAFGVNKQHALDTLSRYEILKRYAPIFHMAVNTNKAYYEGQDLIVAVDQDKNWGTYDDDIDVWADDSHWQRTTIAHKLHQIDPQKNDITPVVYTSFLELKKAYVLSYELYHTYNEVSPGKIFDHMGDIEGVTLIVSKNGEILGASSTAHSHKIWSIPLAAKSRPGIIHRHHKKMYTLKLTNTHAHFWVGANGPIDLLHGSRGHAIYPYAKKQSKTGISYKHAENNVAQKPQTIGRRKEDKSYSQQAFYQLVPEEELLVKNLGSKRLGAMYRLGQSMSKWGGRLWGNGYYGYISDGPRKRYNSTYSTPLDTSWVFHPQKNIGRSSKLFVVRDNALNLNTDITSFYRNGAVLQGGGFMENDAHSISPLHFHHTLKKHESICIEAKVLRVGKLHLNSGWYSNPFGEKYVNGIGPSAGIMLLSSIQSSGSYVYIAYAPEIDKIVLVTKALEEAPVFKYFDKDYRQFRLQKKQDIIKVQVRQNENKPWETLTKFYSGEIFKCSERVYGCLLVQSDVNSNEPFYWTNAELDQIKVEY